MDEELLITYGNKSNEELLFLYGEAWRAPYQAIVHTLLPAQCIPLDPAQGQRGLLGVQALHWRTMPVTCSW